MGQKTYRRISQAEVEEMWSRFYAGENLRQIGAAMDRNVGSIQEIFAARGGVRPPPRCRAAAQLTLEEREQISRGLVEGLGMRALARRLGRAPSTISREIARHGGATAYRAVAADARAYANAQRPKPSKLATCPPLRRVVEQQLRRCWSPMQIAQWLRQRTPDDPTMTVSHETIYRTLFIQARGAFRKELTQYLRTQRSLRRSAQARAPGRGQIPHPVTIAERPASIEDRAIPGHWEGDLLLGGHTSQIITLVERTSRFVQLLRVPRRDTLTVVAALTRHARRLPAGLMQSLTWDRGHELSQHQRFTVATKIQVYFCDPHSPWQRGTNENTNGLLRQYFPKGHDLSAVTQAQLNRVARELNTRPRQTLNFQTPAAVLARAVALTG
jgi:IS30 family transposase